MRAPRGNARACVLACLIEWDSSRRYAADILEQISSTYELEPIDRALVTELFYGTLRNLSLLDGFIENLRNRGGLKSRVRCLIRLGLQQIFNSNVADHAAVNETVNLAKRHERGLVNAILRNALRRRDDLLNEAADWPLSVRYSHPPFLIERWNRHYGEEDVRELCRWNNLPPAVYARVCDEEAFHREWSLVDPDGVTNAQKEPSIEPEMVPGYPEFIKLPPGPPPRDLIDTGTIYIQDPSTSIAPWLLAPEPGETVLDACAAPGGKTAILASMCPVGTQLFATDGSPGRITRMKENLMRLKIDKMVNVSEVDWSDPMPEQLRDLPKFDAILLDVPCSNTGVMRRRVDVRWRLRSDDFADLKRLQCRILSNARRQLKPGGRIVYSTCSIEPGENREVVEQSGMEIVEIRETLPWRDGVDGAFAACLRESKNVE